MIIIDRLRTLPAWLQRTLGLILTLAAIACSTLLAPEEQSLGSVFRLVLVHGAWVWAGQIIFWLAALTSLAGLLMPHIPWTDWSRAAGRAGMIFWITYLPMSLLVMKLAWGGLFFDEPRWRVPFAFGVAGLLLQIALALMQKDVLTNLGNLVFGVALFISRYEVPEVLHPDSPLSGGASWRISLSFTLLLMLCLFIGAQVTLWLKRLKI